MARRLRRSALTALVALFTLVFAATSSNALSYAYYAGHPMYFGGPGAGGFCTGSWTVHGTSGSFILTAGHCAPAGTRVHGTGAAFGTIAHQRFGGGQGDSALVAYDTGVTTYQTVVDPRTGASPGDGRVTGKMPTSQQTVGVLVGKMGVTTGWTEGSIAVSYNWYGTIAHCASYGSGSGDSGGPVWRLDGEGLRAVGMHVGRITYSSGTSYGCYIPMDTLLTSWGAEMNFWPRTAERAAAGDLMPTTGSGADPELVSAEDGWTALPD